MISRLGRRIESLKRIQNPEFRIQNEDAELFLLACVVPGRPEGDSGVRMTGA
jgi:hypothetical protein